MGFAEAIRRALLKFDLHLDGCRVLTEAATGNYVVTPLIAAAAGAEVTAFTRSSAYGSVEEVQRQTLELAAVMNLSDRVKIVTDLASIDLSRFDIVTNTGFLRPLDAAFVARLSPTAVIPLMYEPWEFRAGEIDLASCRAKGIPVFGTNEADSRLRTMEYIGLIVLYFLLERKLSPFSVRVLVLGCEQFVSPVMAVLARNGYTYRAVTSYAEPVDPRDYDAVVVAEYIDPRLLVGPAGSAYLAVEDLRPDTFVIHISGNVNFSGARFTHVPVSPRPFRHMSYTTDFIDPQAVVDLHAAGLKVGEGMLTAKRQQLCGVAFREFMEKNYPALAMDQV